MPTLPDIAWLGIGLLIGFGVIQILRALAIGVRNETMVHDLRYGVAKIQVERFHSEMLRHGVLRREELEAIAAEEESGDSPGDGASAREPGAPEAETDAPQSINPARDETALTDRPSKAA